MKGLSEENVKNIFVSLQPIVESSNEKSPLLLHISKILLVFFFIDIKVILEEFPKLTLEGVSIFTKSKGLKKWIPLVTMSLYPWSSMSQDLISLVLNEFFDFKNMNESRMIQLISETLSNQNLFQSFYEMDEKIKSLNNNHQNPIVSVLSSILISCDDTKLDILTCMEILFFFAYKSGSSSVSELNQISKLRIESTHCLRLVCNRNIHGLRSFLSSLQNNITFIHKTQPKLLDHIYNFIQSFELSFQFEIQDVKMIQNLLIQENITKIKEISESIARVLIEKISWKNQTIQFQMLEIMIQYASNDMKSLEWFAKFMSKRQGLEMIEVKDTHLAEEFLLKVQKNNDIEVPITLLIQLSICEKNNLEFKFLEKIQILSECGNLFVPSMVSKYIDLLSHSELEKVKHILDQLSLIHIPFQEITLETIQSRPPFWSYLLLKCIKNQNCVFLLNSLIRQEYKKNQSISSFPITQWKPEQ